MSNRFPADDEHLHPYPGNLKHHKVNKKEQRKLLCEMMKDDAKSGMYDLPKREPLLSDEQISNMAFLRPADAREMFIADRVCEAYEAARAKDAELIQQLVDALHFERMSLVSCIESQKALDAAAAAGFKPSEE